MVQPRYHRDGSEFWLAYWYQEMGGDDIELPEFVTTDWWKGLCLDHVIELSRYVSGFHVAMNNPLDARTKRMMEKSQMEWDRLEILCPEGEGYDGLILDIVDLTRWYSPALKKLMRTAFKVRHMGSKHAHQWDERYFNRTTTVIGNEYRNWSFDFRHKRHEWNLDKPEYQIKPGGEVALLISRR